MIIKIRTGEIPAVVAGDNRVAGAPPQFGYGMELPMSLAFYHDDPTMTAYEEAELSDFVSWQFAIDSDFTDTTNPAVLVTTGFTLSGNTLSFIAFTNTARFLTILASASSASATAEIKGWKSGKVLPGFVQQFAVTLRGAVVAGTAVPPVETEYQYMLTSAIHALLALYTNFSETLTPDQLTANADDYEPQDLDDATVLRLSADGEYSITGIAAPAASRLIIIHNIGDNSITLASQNVASLAANRFAIDAAGIALPKDSAIMLQYDVVSERWRAIGGTPGSGGGGGTAAAQDTIMMLAWMCK